MRRARRAASLLVLLALVAGAVLPAAAQRRRTTRRPPRLSRAARTTRTPAPEPRLYTLGADTVIRVRQNEQISSGRARIGDRFTTTVVDPVYASGVEVIPAGSKVLGRVTTVHRAQRRRPGNISVSYTAIELPDGTKHAISGSLTSLQAGDVNADNESTVEGRANTKRDMVFIGGGAATGAIIGAIAGGGKGAGIGALIGGGLGTVGRVIEKEQEAVVKPGTEYGVILNRAVQLPASNVH